jgi:hypothetical protein
VDPAEVDDARWDEEPDEPTDEDWSAPPEEEADLRWDDPGPDPDEEADLAAVDDEPAPTGPDHDEPTELDDLEADLSEAPSLPSLPGAQPLPIVPLQFVIRVEGRPVEARLDPWQEKTRWERPGSGSEPRQVALEIASLTVTARVECAPAAQERIHLGRDVLGGRFLLRP